MKKVAYIFTLFFLITSQYSDAEDSSIAEESVAKLDYSYKEELPAVVYPKKRVVREPYEYSHLIYLSTFTGFATDNTYSKSDYAKGWMVEQNLGVHISKKWDFNAAIQFIDNKTKVDNLSRQRVIMAYGLYWRPISFLKVSNIKVLPYLGLSFGKTFSNETISHWIYNRHYQQKSDKIPMATMLTDLGAELSFRKGALAHFSLQFGDKTNFNLIYGVTHILYGGLKLKF